MGDRVQDLEPAPGAEPRTPVVHQAPAPYADILRLQATAGNRAVAQVMRAPAGGAAPAKQVVQRTITQVTLFVDRDIVVLELDGKDTVTLKATFNGKPGEGTYAVSGTTSTPRIGGTANSKGFVVEWTDPPGTKLTKAPSFRFSVVAGRPGSSDGPANRVDGGEGEDERDGGGGGKEGDGVGGGDKGSGQADQGDGPGSQKSDQAGRGADPQGAGDEDAIRLTAEEEEVWREIARLMKGAGGLATTESPAETVRLFKVLRSMVVQPKFGTTGESWIKFAHFLEQNRDKIEGYFRSAKGGKITSAVLQKIVNDYGAFLAMTPDQEGPQKLESDADYDKEFKYDPGWRNLSPVDRKLLLDYARSTPGPASDKKIDFNRVGTGQKIMMALRMADNSVLGEMAEAAKNAFTDPKFIVTLIVSMGIYVGLWLTPDPSWVTKIAAGVLTAVMLSQFAIEDIYGFAVAWSDFSDACTSATTGAELKAAGEAFLKRIGPIGFDIMMFVVMWRIGKKAGPKLARKGAEMDVTRAQKKLDAAKAETGSGAALAPETGPHPVAEARAAAGEGATPAQVLDTLAARLPEPAKTGLANFRAKTPAEKVLAAVEGSKSPLRMLAERAMTKEAQAAAKAGLAEAQLELARARLILAETFKDAALRKTVQQEQGQVIEQVLKELGKWDTAEFQDALLRGDTKAVSQMLRKTVEDVRKTASDFRPTETQGAIGEALQRSMLRAQYANKPKVKFLSNIGLMRLLPEVKSVGEWAKAERARLTKEGKLSAKDIDRQVGSETAKMFEKDGQIYRAVGEVDTMVVEPGPDGRLAILELAEAKTGAHNTPGEASGQLTRAVTELRAVGEQKSTTQVFQLEGKRGLGADITQQLALDKLQKTSPDLTTFGPEGAKLWDVKLGFTEAEFKQMAESLLRNLPPDKQPTARTPVGPREEEDEKAPAQ